MKDFKNIDEILDFAIQNEQNAVDFYIKLADRVKTDDMKATFQQFAKEEMGHKTRLTRIKEEGIFETSDEKILDLKMPKQKPIFELVGCALLYIYIVDLESILL